MTTDPLTTPSGKPRLLWANVYCLLDTSSGASMAVLEMLRQLVANGYEVAILGATIFDHERGNQRLKAQWDTVQAKRGQLIIINDESSLQHRLLVTANTQRSAMTSKEENSWFGLYQAALDQFKPDVVFYYGGQTLDLLIPNEAQARGIAAVAYLANGNYSGTRWCRDLDMIITDSQATADKYAALLPLRPVPVGTFINPLPVLATEHTRKHLLFINPCPQKGVAIVIQLALLLEKRRPDIIFEIVESRGSWQQMLQTVSAALGTPREQLDNVVVTANTNDMRPLYGRARVLLAPSVGWESGARVIAEAMLNGIPAIVTDLGGSPEMMRNGGVKLNLPAVCHEKPYSTLPPLASLEPVVQLIIQWYDDAEVYAEYAARAQQVGQQLHNIAVNTRRLMAALQPLVVKRAMKRGFVLTEQAMTTSDPVVREEKVPLVLVCGPWSSGTSATAGVLAALGLSAPGPFVTIADPRTQHTCEMKAFQRLLQSLVSEQSLERLVSPVEMLRALRQFRDVTLKNALQEQGMNPARPVMLKHALASFILPEISQVFDLQLVLVSRPLKEIENTRLRRQWPARYGRAGASLIYGNMFSFMVNSGVPCHVLRYPELLQQPAAVIDELLLFLDLPIDAAQRQRAIATLAGGNNTAEN